MTGFLLISVTAALIYVLVQRRRDRKNWQLLNATLIQIARGDYHSELTRPDHSRGHDGDYLLLREIRSRLLALEKKVSEEEFDLRGVFQSMIEGVMIIDHDNRIRLCNDAFRTIFSVSGETTGMTVMEVLRNYDLQMILNKALQEGRVTNHEITAGLENEKVLKTNALRLVSSEGSTQGVVVVFHDVTTIKRLEAMRKEFVANVSHELRTPLAIIRGYSETLLDGPIDDPTQVQKFHSAIHRHTIRMTLLIDDLMELTKLESGRFPLTKVSTHLPSLLERTLGEFEEMAGRKNLSLSIEGIGVSESIYIDPKLIERVMYNLLDNAVKYTPEGGKVVITLNEKNSETQVTVADTGPGIPLADQPHIFERFYRVEKGRTRDVGGTGLGLSICKHIVFNHGGRIWVESEPGKGSRFHFVLPDQAIPTPEIEND
ncbi:MAG: ATP-binding protein [Verrucomicrobiota bacterium]|nr:ATP-binding protein [Verrucomicrobiota bacterium]